MGRAVIVANKQGGLYTVKMVYDLTRINKELEDLEKQQSEYNTLLIRAIDSKNLLADEKTIAEQALNAIINQWQQDLLNAGDPPPLVPPTEDDPETGQLWDPPDKAQYGPLEDAINAARTAAGKSTLTRDDDLDFAARRHVLDMSGSSLMGHIGSDKSTPDLRILVTGYQADFAVELVACGPFTATSAANNWAINAASSIYSDAATELGVAYTYSTSHPATHLWVALLANPDPDPPPLPASVTFPDDPAQKAARKSEDALDKIETPKTEVDIPKNLLDAVKKFSEAKVKYVSAEKELSRLMAEKLVRNLRITELTALKASADTPIDAWCTQLIDNIPIGLEVGTAEPPGYYREGTISGSGRIYSGTPREQTVFYTVGLFNIAPFSTAVLPQSKLNYSTAMTPAAVFYNAAIEPGHLKWKPIWRYGTLTSVDVSTSSCSLTLETIQARKLDDEAATLDLSLDENLNLTNVTISYPPCNARAFKIGDQVLVLFEGFNRDTPKVVGFRFVPRDCTGRTSWTTR